MKKIYCKNCKYYKGRVLYNLNICTNKSFLRTDKEDEWRLGRPNEKNDCSYFAKKWWKFWIK